MKTKTRNRTGMEDRSAMCASTAEALERIGFSRSQMLFQESLRLETDEGEIVIPVEILVSVEGEPALLVKCVDGPPSAREEAAVAMARLHPRGPFPVALVGDGTDVLVIDANTRRILGRGFEAVPSASAFRSGVERERAAPADRVKRERDERILAAYYYLRCPVPKDPY